MTCLVYAPQFRSSRASSGLIQEKNLDFFAVTTREAVYYFGLLRARVDRRLFYSTLDSEHGTYQVYPASVGETETARMCGIEHSYHDTLTHDNSLPALHSSNRRNVKSFFLVCAFRCLQ